jgi:FkbM family methyltransferase
MRIVELAGRQWQWTDKDRACQKYLSKHWPDALTAVSFVPGDRRGICVQAGGNFGVWPWLFSRQFERVLTFEPEPNCFACLKENLKDTPNVEPYQLGLADRPTIGKFKMVDGNHGAQYLEFDKGGVMCTALDKFELPGLDLLDLDIEGAEALALEGAKETIAKYKPTIAVEDWVKNGAPGHHARNYSGIISGAQWLLEHGYAQVARIAQDKVFVAK